MNNSKNELGRFDGFSRTFQLAANNLAETGRARKQLVSLMADGILAWVCLWAAYSLRHGQIFSDFRGTWYIFLIMSVVTVGCLAALGVYRWVIRSTNERLYKQIFKGSVLSALVLLIAFFLIPPDRANPRSLFVIYGVLLFLATAGVRFVWRAAFESLRSGEPIAVFGAGSAGQQLVHLLQVEGQYRPVAFIDDDISLQQTTLFGLPICSADDKTLLSMLARNEVSKVVLAMPSVATAQYHRKVQQLGTMGLTVLTMPSVEELMDGSARADEIRDVSINDILGRTEVAPSVNLMGRRVSGKTVLVTGGGGSIGSEICRQIMKLGPKKLLVLDNSEANLYHVTEELLKNLSRNTVSEPTEFVPTLGSVLDQPRINKLMVEHNIDTVYHAAAYKHVPIVEAQPDQGVDVNVFGTKTVLDCAIANGVSDFVLISTDKAVRPTNSMGASKRVAELVLQATAAESNGTRISMVRFGNVLGSSGSVVPKFKKQILEGGPITLTHTEVTRYFMTIPEASQLVLQASAIAKGGEVFVLDMGEPVRIEELAVTMVRLFGKSLQRDTGNSADIAIVVEGLRPGEKLYEELFISDTSQRTEVPKISSANEGWISWEELQPKIDELKQLADAYDLAGIRKLLLNLAFINDQQFTSEPELKQAQTNMPVMEEVG